MVGGAKVAVAPRGTVHLQVNGRAGIPLYDASAVVLNVTVVSPSSSGYVTAYAEGTTRPPTYNVLYMKAQNVSNAVLARVGANGRVAFYNSSAGTVHLIVDVSGYYPGTRASAAGEFGLLAPSRLLDTRTGVGVVGSAKVAVGARRAIRLQVTGKGGVPTSGVSAVVLNVTAAAPTSSGYVTVYGAGATRPAAYNVLYAKAQNRSNLVIAPVGLLGRIDLYNASDGKVHLIADVCGYYLAGTPAVMGAFKPIPSSRLLDTRTGVGVVGATKVAIAARGTVQLQVTGRGGVPASLVSAVVLNVTAASPKSPGYVTVYGDGTARPPTYHGFFTTAQNRSNVVITRVGNNGKVSLYNASAGTIHLIADVSGYYRGAVVKANSVSTGYSHSCAATHTGGVRCWGSNAYGQLGNGTTTSSAVPVDVAGLGSWVVEVWVGEHFSCALTNSHGVKCWGRNTEGQLGNGSTIDSRAPVNVVGLTSGTEEISVGRQHSCARTTDGGIRCWGSNGYGELGNGTKTRSSVPVLVALGSPAIDVSAGGHHSCAVTNGNTVRCWGDNTDGALGNGTITSSAVPVNVLLGTPRVANEVSAGLRHSCTRTTMATVRCWGDNSNGQLGDGTTKDSLTPVDLAGLGSTARALSTGSTHSCAMTLAYGVSCWGDNGKGQLGNGTTTQSRVAVGVLGLASGTASISTGSASSCAVTTAGTVKCWGDNASGQLGNGTTTSSSSPVNVISLG